MATYTNLDNVRQWTDEELKQAVSACQNEIYRREAERKDNLVENFRQAFYALGEANIAIKYCDRYGDSIYIEDFDDFHFI